MFLWLRRGLEGLINGESNHSKYFSVVSSDDKTSLLPALANSLVKEIFEFARSRPQDCKLNCIHIVNSNDESTEAVREMMTESLETEKTRVEHLTKEIQKCKLSERIQDASMNVNEDGDFSPSEDGDVYENPMKTEQPQKQTTTDTKADDKNHNCVICLETLDKNHKTLQKCNHKFCTPCIDKQFTHKPVCPTCGEVYGVVTGTQPKGTMTVQTINQSCPGYEEYKTHMIEYQFPQGIQGVSTI